MSEQLELPGLPPFPTWLINGEVIGENEDGEALAVGLRPDGVTWLARLSHYSRFWCSVREASKEEIGKYDELILKKLGVSLD